MWIWQLCRKAHRHNFDFRLSFRLSGICPLLWSWKKITSDFFIVIIRGHLCEDRSGLNLVITSQADWVFIWRRAETGKIHSGFPQWQVKLFSTAGSDFCYSTVLLWSTHTSMSPWVIFLTETKSYAILYCKTRHFCALLEHRYTILHLVSQFSQINTSLFSKFCFICSWCLAAVSTSSF